MEILLLVLTLGLPLVKILMFPAKAIGWGGNWTLVGAAMIVALMMVLWFGMQSVTDTAAGLNGATAPGALSSQPLPDLDAIAKLL